jgi:exodeoxyribonuclease III
MKLATFNINNVNKRLPNLLAWLRAAAPDVVCLQELKSPDADFPIDALRGAGYEAVWRGQKAWNGVGILARGMEPVLTRSELPGDAADMESRYIEAAVNGILIGCLYAPNGNPRPGPKFNYKLAWLARLIRHARSLLKAGDELRLFRSIATMNPKAPLRRLLDQKPTWQEAAALAKKWHLKQLSVRLDAMPSATIAKPPK